MFLIARPTTGHIQEFLARQKHSRFSYPGIGSSSGAFGPNGYVIDHTRTRLGSGAEVWNAAIRAINEWRMFSMEWLQLCWPDAPILEGTNVAVLIRHFGFWSLNAARIVYTISDRGAIMRYGFGYGTLLDHSERGEERFLVEWHTQDNSVWYDLFAFSRPQTIAAKLAYPLTRLLQRRFREDSKAAMTKSVV